MSIEQQTTKQISDNIIAQLETSLNQTIPLLPKAFNRVLAKALGGIWVLLYKYGGFIFLQIFVSTASFKDTEVNGVIVNPLKFWGRLIGVGDPGEAIRAELNVDITVLNQVGSLQSGTQLIGDFNGVTYILVGEVVLNAPIVQGVIRAAKDQSGGNGSGAIGNLEVGQTVPFANPLPNVDRITVVASQVTTGADGETEASYRQRIADRFQKKPQGGAYADYEIWGEEQTGIINVYPYTGQPGEVDVYSEATPESSGSPDGIPTTAQLEAVLNLINLDENGIATRRNANAFVNSYPITRTGFDVDVTGIVGVDNLAAVQEDITTALGELFFGFAPFIEGLSIPPRNDRVTSTIVNSTVDDIVRAAGGTFTSAILKLSGSPSAITAYSLGEGEKSKVVTVAFP